MPGKQKSIGHLAVKVAHPIPSSEYIEIEDINGISTIVTLAHWNRYPQLADSFRPVAEKKAAPAATTPPTGDDTKEN